MLADFFVEQLISFDANHEYNKEIRSRVLFQMMEIISVNIYN